MAGGLQLAATDGTTMEALMRRTVMAALVLAVGLASPAAAQQNATLVLRSGEKLGGELVDMGAGGLSFRVNGQPRKFPLDQVAVIDFVGGGNNIASSELDQVGDGGVVTTDGQSVRGTLYDVAGRFPLKITIDLPGGGTRDYRSTDLKRIYVARPPSSSTGRGGSPSTPSQPSTPGGSGTVRVAGNQRWVDTGLTVRQGDRVRFSATGEVQLSSDGGDVATPAGSKTGRRPGGPMPQTLAGALIGRIGAARMFGIGDQTTPLPMPADGRLFLGVNDDNVDDNRGEFQVEVTRSGGSRSRR
jgi:hypothetical protein